MNIQAIYLYVLTGLFLIIIGLLVYLVFSQLAQKNDWDRVLKLDKKLKNRIAKKIEEGASDEVSKVINTLSVRLAKVLEDELLQLRDKTSVQVGELSDFMRDQQKTLIEQSEFLLASAITKTEKELESYKNKRISEMNARVFEIIAASAKEVLGKTINPNEHEELVEKALDAAKREKFFS